MVDNKFNSRFFLVPKRAEMGRGEKWEEKGYMKGGEEKLKERKRKGENKGKKTAKVT